MEDAIKNIAKQFAFDPVIENEAKIRQADSFVLGGMGGSHLAAGLIKIFDPSIDLYIHRDYGLPQLASKRFKESLFIASSHSGNTEEVLDFAEKAFAEHLNLVVVSTGGKLIEFAKRNGVPYIVLPDDHVQPRVALGFAFLALVKIIMDDGAVVEVQEQGSALDALGWQAAGTSLAMEIRGKIPIIYSSRANQALAYSWKIKFNETTKIPAFHNVFPEVNHNEMTGFDYVTDSKKLTEHFYFLLLEDTDDQPRIMRRMEVLKGMYEDRGYPVKAINITGQLPLEKIFNSMILADWTAFALAQMYGAEPEQVPMVEEFKKLIA